ncbi:IS200/IS605 family transposase [Microseira wollei]|uniref:Transposase IS200-family protein n=1 Tax=Microseira wollei NIES-4236 TaxID=2530354 RepID=A0AAV3X2P8_9CYAN|nr:IS200/IS605 family transposase [Microseira wollei]GET35416.1 transposase IS200-family protein [Microseira wollei NIES-4236]
MSVRKGSHSVFSVHLHFVFVTKYRRKVLTAQMLDRMREIFAHVCLKTKCRLVEFNGESDHVHLLVDFHPDNNISAFTGSLKSASIRIIRNEFGEHLNKFYRNAVLWSSSYYVASTGGAPIEKVKAYIKSQDSPQE